MQKNDFEKQVQQQLEDFSVLPADAVWEKVASKIEAEKKRRRILFFWLFAGILLLGGASGIYMMSNNTEGKISALPKESTFNLLKNKEKEPHRIDTNERKDELVKKIDLTENNIVDEKQNNKNRNKPETIKKQLVERWSIPIVLNKPLSTTNKKETLSSIKTIEEKEAEVKKFKETASTIEAIVAVNSKIISIQDSIENKPATKENFITNQQEIIPATTNQTKDVPIKKGAEKTKKQWHVGAMLLGGISDNVKSAPFFPSTKSAERSQFANQLSAVSQVSSNMDEATGKYSNSYSFGAGVFAQKSVTKKWGISVGANYQFMSANVAVGARVDSSKTFQDSVMQKTKVVNTFYRPGSNNSYHVNYHLLQIPVSMMFQLNKNAEKPLTLSAGVSANFLIGSKALYLNQKALAIYREKEQFKNFTLGVQTGMTFTLSTHKNFSIHAGPQVQYQVSNLTKSIIYTDEHLLFLGFKANILFKRNK
jgi:hypothetical protein